MKKIGLTVAGGAVAALLVGHGLAERGIPGKTLVGKLNADMAISYVNVETLKLPSGNYERTYHFSVKNLGPGKVDVFYLSIYNKHPLSGGKGETVTTPWGVVWSEKPGYSYGVPQDGVYLMKKSGFSSNSFIAPGEELGNFKIISIFPAVKAYLSSSHIAQVSISSENDSNPNNNVAVVK